MIITALVFLLILTVLVLIHELGHFIMARKFGIKVEEFGFGIPPRAFGIKRGETLYSINWLPIGGFVKLYGEDDAGAGRIKSHPIRQAQDKESRVKDTDEDRAFYVHSVWQRATVVVAGVVMNAVLAALIFYLFLFLSNFHTTLPLLGNHTFFGVTQTNVSAVIVDQVSKSSPAATSGIEAPVQIISLNGDDITNTTQFVATINTMKGKEVVVAWKDAKNAVHQATMVPRNNPPKGEGALGIRFYATDVAQLDYKTPMQIAFSGIVHPVNLMLYNFDVLGQLFRVSVKEKTVEPISQGVSGPVGIFSLVGNILQLPDAKERLLQVLNLAGILSISLAFFNVLPIPALDGGRLFFILIEGFTGRKVNQKFEAKAHAIGMMVLLLLIALIAFQDIHKIFTGQIPLPK